MRTSRFPDLRTASIATGVLFLGCAYLNTFYNAKVAFGSALREQKRFLRTNTDSTAQLPTTVIAGYDRAIEKSKKVLEVYPKKVKWHDDARFLMGRASYYKGDMRGAVRRLRKLQMEHPESPYIPESYLYLGKAYMESDNLLKAEETFNMVLDRYPELNEDEQVTLLLAELAIRREGKARAIGLLEETLKTVTSAEKRIEIIIKMSNLYMQLRQFDKAVGVLKEAPRRKEFSGYLFQVDMNLLDCYTELGRLQEALELIERMMKNKRYAGHDAEVLLKKAFVIDKMGKQDEAVALFERIAEGEGPDWVRGRAYYELALIYQHRLGDFEKARECYEQASTLSNDDEIKLVASDRAEAISWLQTSRDSLITAREVDPADTAAPPGTPEPIAYRIGEVFWLKLQEPDSALSHFDAVAHDTLSDSLTVRKALFAGAWISKHMKADSARSDSIFELILTRYPASMFAKRAQKELGMEVTIMTREDSAQQAFLAAEDLYFEEGDPKAAVNSYYRVARTYADLEDIASRSIYSAAWLCDNVLRKEVTARKLYTMLCDSFPESEYCRSEARPRLRFVEDSLKTLRQRREQRKQETREEEVIAAETDDGREVPSTEGDPSDPAGIPPADSAAGAPEDTATATGPPPAGSTDETAQAEPPLPSRSETVQHETAPPPAADPSEDAPEGTDVEGGIPDAEASPAGEREDRDE